MSGIFQGTVPSSMPFVTTIPVPGQIVPYPPYQCPYPYPYPAQNSQQIFLMSSPAPQLFQQQSFGGSLQNPAAVGHPILFPVQSRNLISPYQSAVNPSSSGSSDFHFVNQPFGFIPSAGGANYFMEPVPDGPCQQVYSCVTSLSSEESSATITEGGINGGEAILAALNGSAANNSLAPATTCQLPSCSSSCSSSSSSASSTSSSGSNVVTTSQQHQSEYYSSPYVQEFPLPQQQVPATLPQMYQYFIYQVPVHPLEFPSMSFQNPGLEATGRNFPYKKAYWYKMRKNSSSSAPAQPQQPSRPMCGFCKSNREPKDVYRGHWLRNDAGELTCPSLRKYVCPVCQATGDDAHTIKYCPVAPPAPASAPVHDEEPSSSSHSLSLSSDDQSSQQVEDQVQVEEKESSNSSA